MKTITVIEDRKEYKVRTYGNGAIYWHLNGKNHREKGPAYLDEEYDFIVWKQNGLYHRLDGPAIIYTSGRKAWWIRDKNFSEKTHTKARMILAFGLDKI